MTCKTLVACGTQTISFQISFDYKGIFITLSIKNWLNKCQLCFLKVLNCRRSSIDTIDCEDVHAGVFTITCQ